MSFSQNMCTSCLGAARRATSRTSIRPPSLFPTPSRAYNIVSTAAPSLHLHFFGPFVRRTPKSQPANLNAHQNAIPKPLKHSAIRRPFATTTTSPTSSPSHLGPAHPILHPRTTESGEPLRIYISPRAAHRLSAISASDNNPSLALRVTVESGGCHGFQYLMNLIDLSKSPASDEDTVFEGDKAAKVVMDEASLKLLSGSTVDYTMELIGSQFKITGIPGATSSCGCGTSFDIKI